MKTFVILFAFFFTGFCATAQKTQNIKKTPGFHKSFEQCGEHSFWKHQKKLNQGHIPLVRLYKYKNSRVKKALSFTTPWDKAKLA